MSSDGTCQRRERARWREKTVDAVGRDGFASYHETAGRKNYHREAQIDMKLHKHNTLAPVNVSIGSRGVGGGMVVN